MMIKNKKKKERAELTKKVIAELLRINEEQGIDILQMPDEEIYRWIAYLVRQYYSQ